MKRILPAIFVLILTACASPARTSEVTSSTAEVTVTLTPTPTFTETPTATASPEPTATPHAVELSAAEQKAWKKAVAPAGFEYRDDGTMWDLKNGKAVEGINWKVGTYTESYAGQELALPITPDKIIPMKDANGTVIPGQFDLAGLAHWWDGKEGKLVRETYNGEPVYFKEEKVIDLIKDGDVSVRTFDQDVMIGQFFSPGGGGSMILHYKSAGGEGINEAINRYYWGDNRIFKEDMNDYSGWKVTETTTFSMSKLRDEPYSVMIYALKDDGTNKSLKERVRLFLLDSGDYVADASDPDHTLHNNHPKSWSGWYDPDKYPDHTAEW